MADEKNIVEEKVDDSTLEIDPITGKVKVKFGTGVGKVPGIGAALGNNEIVETRLDGTIQSISKKTGYNRDFGVGVGNIPNIGSTLQVSKIIETDVAGKMKTVAKSTAFNKNFGTEAGTICEGNAALLKTGGLLTGDLEFVSGYRIKFIGDTCVYGLSNVLYLNVGGAMVMRLEHDEVKSMKKLLMHENQIKECADPTDAQDVATKIYADVPRYTQEAEPDIPNDTQAIWIDSDDGNRVWHIVDVNGTQYKVELTEMPHEDNHIFERSWSSELDTDLAVTTGKHKVNIYIPDGYTTATIKEVRMRVGTVPTGAVIIGDIHFNGTTIFTDQDKRPTIAISEDDSGKVTDIDVTDISAGGYFTFDIDQVGSIIAGQNLVTVLVIEITP